VNDVPGEPSRVAIAFVAHVVVAVAGPSVGAMDSVSGVPTVSATAPAPFIATGAAVTASTVLGAGVAGTGVGADIQRP
jgi:hypothetical protein